MLTEASLINERSLIVHSWRSTVNQSCETFTTTWQFDGCGLKLPKKKKKKKKKIVAILQNDKTVEYCWSGVKLHGFKINGPVNWSHTGQRSGTTIIAAQINPESGKNTHFKQKEPSTLCFTKQHHKKQNDLLKMLWKVKRHVRRSMEALCEVYV